MKITTEQLRQIIREELKKTLKEEDIKINPNEILTYIHPHTLKPTKIKAKDAAKEEIGHPARLEYDYYKNTGKVFKH